MDERRTPVRIELRGRLGANTAPQVRARLLAGCERAGSDREMVVDLSETTLVVSNVLRALLDAARALPGRLCLVGCRPAVARAVRIVGLDQLAEVRDDARR